MDLIILTGMSGAGKSQAVNYLEDQGYFCIDNLPPMILPELVRTFIKGQGGEGYSIDRLAFVVDIRSNELLKGFDAAMEEIDQLACPYRIIFLEAADQVLVNRYRETRRRHPLATGIGLSEAISRERVMLQELRERATHVVDTSMMAIPALREELQRIISRGTENQSISVLIESFGFKYGIPVDCDNICDVRFLPNPFYETDLRMCSGHDEVIRTYLNTFPETGEYIDKQANLLHYLMPFYVREGKVRLMIGIGCTGGRHRSVFIAEELSTRLNALGIHTAVHHRDIGKDPRYAVINPDPDKPREE